METAITQTENTEKKSSVLRAVWNRWLEVAVVIGTVQMVIILSIIYWLMMPFMAIPFKLLSDPLATKAHRAGWIKRDPNDNTIEAMRNQF